MLNQQLPPGDPFGADLQRAASVTGGLGNGFVIGSDPLASGRIEVEGLEDELQQPGEAAENEDHQQGEVRVALQQAVPSVAYRLEFCRFATGPAGCFSIGAVETDEAGNAQMELVFPQQGAFTGVFILTRSIAGQDTSEFVTGFQAP